MSLLRIAVVPLLKVILPRQVLLRFSAAYKASSFSKFHVALSSEFHTTVPLYIWEAISSKLCCLPFHLK